MKKVLAALLLICAVSALAACSGSGNSSDAPAVSSSGAEENINSLPFGVSEDYIAVFYITSDDGNTETYVYKGESGYDYYSITKSSAGQAVKKSTGIKTKDRIFEIIAKQGEVSYAMRRDDTKKYTFEEMKDILE